MRADTRSSDATPVQALFLVTALAMASLNSGCAPLDVLAAAQVGSAVGSMSRGEVTPGTHVSVEPAGIQRTLVACREAMAKHQLTEIRYEINQRETVVTGRSTNAATIGAIATFQLRNRSADKTVLLIRVPPKLKELQARELFKTVRHSTAVPSVPSAPTS